MIILSVFMILFTIGLFAAFMAILSIIETMDYVGLIHNQIDDDWRKLNEDWTAKGLGFDRIN